jgi:hypothetical protein
MTQLSKLLALFFVSAVLGGAVVGTASADMYHYYLGSFVDVATLCPLNTSCSVVNGPGGTHSDNTIERARRNSDGALISVRVWTNAGGTNVGTVDGVGMAEDPPSRTGNAHCQSRTFDAAKGACRTTS